MPSVSITLGKIDRPVRVSTLERAYANPSSLVSNPIFGGRSFVEIAATLAPGRSGGSIGAPHGIPVAAAGNTAEAGEPAQNALFASKERAMTLCPVAVAIGCKRCPVFAVCPLKTVIGDYRPDEHPKNASRGKQNAGPAKTR